jgi:sterol desaturase/sphingolipid hydroxylase (fatty acid hydroxylase superfamily)
LPESRTSLVLLFLSGVLLWTLAEYLIHRFIFHMGGGAPWQERMKFVAHGVHHDYPNDSRRLVMPPAVSIPLAIVSYSLFYFVWGPGYVFPFYAGFVFGYLVYDMLHFAFHHIPMTGRIPKYLRAYHLRHHFKDDGTAYGVSSPLWDYVFGTVPDRTKSSRS